MDEKKELTRREFLGWAAAVAALALLPGCEPVAYHAEVSPGSVGRLPAGWGYSYAAPSGGAVAAPYESASYETVLYDPMQQPAVMRAVYTPTAQPQTVQTVVYQPQVIQAPVVAPAAPRRQFSSPAPTLAPSGGKLRAVSRQSWAVTPPNPQKMKPMNGVTRLTIHHEGSAKPNNDSTSVQVAATLRRIQGQHSKRMGAGDIGYHFIIDRTGTIWQGRDWRYQGAHTSGANAHNLGVMLLGNFEIQQPTQAQLASMRGLVLSIARMYNLDVHKDVYAHNDFGNTQCPGKNLKPYVNIFKAQ